MDKRVHSTRPKLKNIAGNDKMSVEFFSLLAELGKDEKIELIKMWKERGKCLYLKKSFPNQ